MVPNKIKTRNKRSGDCISYNFFSEVPSKHEIYVAKKVMYLSFDFGWYFIHLDIAC